MCDSKDNPYSHLELLSNLSNFCSEFSAEIIAEDIVQAIAGIFPEYTIGLLLRNRKYHSSRIAAAGNVKFLETTRELLHNYLKPEISDNGNPKIEIGSGEFSLNTVPKLRMLCKGLIFNSENYGILIAISRSDLKLSRTVNQTLNICANIIASSAARASLTESSTIQAFPSISGSPRQVLNSFFKKASTVYAFPAACLIYTLPDSNTVDIYVAGENQSVMLSDFNPDHSLNGEEFFIGKKDETSTGKISELNLPEQFLCELDGYGASDFLLTPLKGKKQCYGYCMLITVGTISQKSIQALNRLISEYDNQFKLSAALLLLISSYKQLAVSDKNELVKLTAATVNHHINNQLAIILGAAQLILLKDNELSDDIRRKVKMIEDNTLRIKDVISSLRNLKNINIAEYLAGEKFLDIG
ncbi:MAG: hypothetical protein GF307_06895 [candidate division Zixibacteria bacterium]|nr:hypothetical protein [candidate division Zixibacteria bacterium]